MKKNNRDTVSREKQGKRGTFGRILRYSIAAVLAAVIAYSGWQLWMINSNYAKESAIHSGLMQYKPDLPAQPGTPGKPQINQSIVNLKARYPGTVGWLTVPNTKIDYPFAQGKDNETYLHADLNQKYLLAGTLFMDYRNHQDFSDFNTVIFGHHMKNGSMFGTLQYFDSQTFFDGNKTGTVFLADKIYTVEFFAYAVLQPTDPYVYNTAIVSDADKTAFLAHMKSIARYWRDDGVMSGDHLITLSTCNYEFENAREALIGKLVQR